MASADLREELNCSICLSLYTEPVSLRCGHYFCRGCLVTVLDTQEETGVYACPKCRAVYPERPLLKDDKNLHSTAKSTHSTQLEQEKPEVLLPPCVDHLASAARTCVQCETSTCDQHLTAPKSGDQASAEPTTPATERKCPVHNEILKYYCTKDGTCICSACLEDGDHKGHQAEPLNKASEKKKKKVNNAKRKVSSKRHGIEKRIQDLNNQRTQEKEKADSMTGRITKLFRDIRKEVDDLEKKVLDNISRQEKQVSQSLSNLIQQLEKQKEELSRKIAQMENVCEIKDPAHILMEELSYDDKSPKSDDNLGEAGDVLHVDEVMISLMLQTGFHQFIDNLNKPKDGIAISGTKKSDISLDIKTANNYIYISQDLKSAVYSEKPKPRAEGPLRFKSKQVLSTQSFSSGKHYWEVDVSGAEKWLIGVANHSIERKIDGNESFIGYNGKSWGLTQRVSLQAGHKNILKKIDSKSALKVVGIYLDYEAGRLSFYKMCDPMGHLHTFTATFKEPLHAAFFLFKDSTIKIIQ
ncbi:E3 ubiquitin-protein ligase TRIM11-like [Hyperolius riggenbachi]|uniref:E3 ubiquitin-protein ligase TRIM11-like n=1 Tax=Hyperolius riggenbachi TaxID=752182 RepID=UPI0035A345DF